MVDSPSGEVTFLFTDIGGSTRLWENHAEQMNTALDRHDVLLRAAIEAHGGRVFSTSGDGLVAAFARSEGAVRGAPATASCRKVSVWKFIVSVAIGLHTFLLLVGLIVGVMAQLGDLVESMIKRDAGIKDSAELIPGHGGVLDRFDSMLFTVPVLYYYFRFFII